VITDSQWVAWSAWLEQLFVNADVTVFEDEKPKPATGWRKSNERSLKNCWSASSNSPRIPNGACSIAGMT
jgi:hypothetical protein